MEKNQSRPKIARFGSVAQENIRCGKIKEE
jgi:hypothetical protein